MPFLDKLLKEKPKTPTEVVTKLLTAFDSLTATRRSNDDRAMEKTHESVAKYLGFAKLLLFGDDEHEATKENATALAFEASRTELLSMIVKHLAELEFESRKDAAQVFGAIVRIKDNEERGPGASYVVAHPELPTLLFRGYDEPAIALNCGAMLRDCLRDDQIARKVLEGPIFLKFFEKVEVANFEIASDAFSTFKDLLVRHKQAVAQYLQEHYQETPPSSLHVLRSALRPLAEEDEQFKEEKAVIIKTISMLGAPPPPAPPPPAAVPPAPSDSAGGNPAS
ncbi:Degreening-related dee76 protein [Tetrabaena socialis]|uniref:Degreening-related dee76 protein n=1 Tax=Tetrabaena socialis TaxID=47790 RepID=A0A2J8AHW9_9CHLO|nr:Degreening-related dee76 protein [Tetrabaena socialis]|eukprot:PNH12115.1 Degreening-related dee76 protein [Tetrabaena socialis]